jgi:hypothetical protein
MKAEQCQRITCSSNGLQTPAVVLKIRVDGSIPPPGTQRINHLQASLCCYFRAVSQKSACRLFDIFVEHKEESASRSEPAEGSVIWMVLREVSVLAALGLVISVPIALGTARVIQSFQFDTKLNDPATLAFAVTILLSAALLAGYGPARRASRISPMIALRQD